MATKRGHYLETATIYFFTKKTKQVRKTTFNVHKQPLSSITIAKTPVVAVAAAAVLVKKEKKKLQVLGLELVFMMKIIRPYYFSYLSFVLSFLPIGSYRVHCSENWQ